MLRRKYLESIETGRTTYMAQARPARYCRVVPPGLRRGRNPPEACDRDSGARGRATGGGHTGLGLAIVRGILELHHAAIHVDSAPGKGTYFWFEPPVKAPIASRAPSTADVPDVPRDRGPHPLPP